MKSIKKIFMSMICLLLVITVLGGCTTKDSKNSASQSTKVESKNDNTGEKEKNEDAHSSATKNVKVSEDGSYTSKNEVATYIKKYKKLPKNFITKNEAKQLGWISSQGNLNKVAPGKSIGGDKFGNFEGKLPKKNGRKYFECDIDYKGGKRNAKRIIFSNDGMIYYTKDHYNNFEKLNEEN